MDYDELKNLVIRVLGRNRREFLRDEVCIEDTLGERKNISDLMVQKEQSLLLRACVEELDEKHKTGQETINREYGAFKPISDAAPKYVLSLDRLDFSRDGIAHINIIDFLLGKKELMLT